MEFRLEPYGPGDDRVLRYLNGAIIKQTPVQSYFTVAERLKNEQNDDGGAEDHQKLRAELEKANAANWAMDAAAICMASTLETQKELPLEWDESRVDQTNGFNALTKLKGIFDNVTQAKSLQLSHTVTKREGKTLKYAIFNRNERLDELAEKALEVSKRIMTSLRVQLKFLETVREVKREFKVLASHRNPVDLTSLDVDYPTSFSINVLFFDVAYNPGALALQDYRSFTQTEGEPVEAFDMEPFEAQENVWELWEAHAAASPFAPQQCLVSYYEAEGEDLLTRLTFPLNVSHFVENNYALSLNGAETPLFERGQAPALLHHLRRGRACLIDRAIFCVLAQHCYANVKAGRHFVEAGGARAFIKYISADALYLECEGRELEVAYRPAGEAEKGDTIWRLLVAKLRDVHVQNWKRQKFLLSNQTHNLLGEFVKYAGKLIRHREAKCDK